VVKEQISGLYAQTLAVRVSLPLYLTAHTLAKVQAHHTIYRLLKST
jgi:hypothetical protein